MTKFTKKEYNLKRHHESKHPTVFKSAGVRRNEKLNKCTGRLPKMLAILKTKASYVVSSLIVKRMKPFIDSKM